MKEYGYIDKSTGKWVWSDSPPPRRKQLPRWPIESVGLGGQARDRGKLAQTLRDRGVPTEVSADGNPICTSQRHMDRVDTALGFANDSYRGGW